MPDLAAYPHISRIFYGIEYFKKNKGFDFDIAETFPALHKWFQAIQTHPYFNCNSEKFSIDNYDPKTQFKVQNVNPVVPMEYFHLWLDQLAHTEKGKKPPLRFPFRYRDKNGKDVIARM